MRSKKRVLFHQKFDYVITVCDRAKQQCTVGMIAVPAFIAIVNSAGYMVSAAGVFGAMSIGYAFGEGIGRLACISFGCCYGKPLSRIAPWMRVVLRRFHFVFWGDTKKIAYESEMDAVAVVPIQAITCCVYVTTALASILLFLEGFAVLAFLTASIVCHAWRIYSESLRADHRGGGKISKY